MKTSADPVHAFGQGLLWVSVAVGHPVVDYVIGVRGFPTVRPFMRNEPNVREPIPPLQLGANAPESLCLLLRKGRIPYQHGIVSQPIKRHAGCNHGIAMLDEHALGSRKHHADFSILLADIL